MKTNLIQEEYNMALENAQKFLEQVMADEALRERVAEKESAEVAALARELGFEMTAEELIESVNMMREPEEEKLKELSLAEMDQAAGGKWFLAEDAPDGHDLIAPYYITRTAITWKQVIGAKRTGIVIRIIRRTLQAAIPEADRAFDRH